MLELHNVRMKPSNVKKKNKGTTECDKSTVTYDVVLHNVKMKPLNVRKKTTKYNKSIVKCDVRTVQCENETLKCEEKK